eukprot:241953_1
MLAQCNLLVYGFIRGHEQIMKPKTIPHAIMDIIVDFYPQLTPFKWDKNKHAGGYEFIDDNTIKNGTQKRFSVLLSENTISSIIATKIKWTIKVNSIEYTNTQKNIYIQLGFLKYQEPISLSISNNEFNDNCKGF